MNDNFLDVHPSDEISKFRTFSKMMRGRKYPFLIVYTDRSEKEGMHWYSILAIDKESDFLLLYTLGIEGLKNFIIQHGIKMVEKLIKRIEKMDKKDKILTFVKLKFPIKDFEELKKGKKHKRKKHKNDVKDRDRLPATGLFEAIILVYLKLLALHRFSCFDENMTGWTKQFSVKAKCFT